VQYDSRTACAVCGLDPKHWAPNLVTGNRAAFLFQPATTLQYRRAIDVDAHRTASIDCTLPGCVPARWLKSLRQVRTARRKATEIFVNPDLDTVVGAAGAIPFAPL